MTVNNLEIMLLLEFKANDFLIFTVIILSLCFSNYKALVWDNSDVMEQFFFFVI